jgi:tetratricopeptide (TPR) repeat protein
MAVGLGPGGRTRPFGRADLRAPRAAPKERAEAPSRPKDKPSLLLSVNRGMLSIELDQPFGLGPVLVDKLALALPNVRFPVDLSGGVTRLRNKRGTLTQLALSIGLQELAGFVAPRLRGVLGEGTPDVGVVSSPWGASVGLRLGKSALAFDVVVVPTERDIRLVPERARGVHLGAPPHVLAVRALAEACRPLGHVVGSAVILEDTVAAIVRQVLPDAGARAPAVEGCRWDGIATDADRLSLHIAVSGAPAALPAEAIRAIEQVDIALDADHAAVAGDLDEARRQYLLALERAPRHPEITMRIAWIDAIAETRTEAALATLVDALPAMDAGLLGGKLLAAIGDEDGAIAAFSRAAHNEPFAPLAALAWLEVAKLATDTKQSLDAIDQAIVRSPALEDARWLRLTTRLDMGDGMGARADAEHLEAAARGPEARYRVWVRAAEAFIHRGYVPEARVLFERALRYAPESAEASLGLARSLRAAGDGRRALDLLARASAIAARKGLTLPEVEIELARGLVEYASDRPAAIARVRTILPGQTLTAEARQLEGRWRAELGDLAGASLAFARLRDAIEAAMPEDADRAASLAAMLVEAADVEENARGDLRAAQRHLGVALRLRPRDRTINATFRRVSTELGRPVHQAPVHQPPVHQAPVHQPPVHQAPVHQPPVHQPPVHQAPVREQSRWHFEEEPQPQTRRSSIPEPLVEPVSSSETESLHDGDEMVAEQLTERLRADPDDNDVARRLAAALGRLGRDMDLLALVSTRIEDGTPEIVQEFLPIRRDVLLRLAATARAEGRISEAELYEQMSDDSLP